MSIVTSRGGSDRAFSKSSCRQRDIARLVMDTAESKWAFGILFASKQWYTVFIHLPRSIFAERYLQGKMFWHT